MSKRTFMAISFPKLKAGQTFQLAQLAGSSVALSIAELAKIQSNPILLITQTMQQANQLKAELPFFIESLNEHEILLLTDWETLPYDHFSPHQEITSNRLACLSRLQNLKKGIVIVSINTLMQKVCPPSFVNHNLFLFKTGDHIAREAFRQQLESAGYRAVQQVFERGEFAIRGSILDLFPMGSNCPFRFDFLDEEIETIYEFDPVTQLTIQAINKIELLPAHEFPFDKQSIERFRTQFRAQFDVRLEPESIYQQISQGILPNGIEYWQPLFFETPLSSLFDYLPKQTLLVSLEQIDRQAQQFWQDIQLRYENYRIDPMRPLLAPTELWQSPEQLRTYFNTFPHFTCTAQSKAAKHSLELPFQPLPILSFNENSKHPTQLLQAFLTEFKGKVVFSVHSEGRKEALLPILKRLGLKIALLNDNTKFQALDQIMHVHDYALMISPCEAGFIDERNEDEQSQIAFISETDLIGQFEQKNQTKQRKIKQTDQLIQSLAELSIGEPVVHLDHGVGRYQGLMTIETNQIPAEYLVLHYANETKLYVPVTALNQISRYLGGDPDNAPLNKLGNDAWQKNRNKAAEKVIDVAAELLDLYAARTLKQGFAFTLPKDDYALFEQAFPYTLTLDQKIAIDAVLADMQSSQPMDRLVCGDVGFGKTEVALRAAFVAVMNQKQVAILVPTTLLAQQHYEKFCDRFAGFPIRVEVLSRFKSAKEQKVILQAVAEGKVDIVIGTHKLLQNDLIWSDLGLLIVDEEHRFGVKQKEKIKALRENIDILTLTATPIPRTLNMALSHMRDLSLITTAPARRLPVKTFVREWDKALIREAMLREILRGGQIFYLHNEVSTINAKSDELRALLPEASIAIAHGKMPQRDLEQVMENFHHQRFNVLLCSTIIETGIDIPNANTILIERADKFGLAQLHQLRGRVGRSHHQAYAYLITPPLKLLNIDAKRRLEAIAQLDELGAGFALASQDLEIRGAGELLGAEQSGQMATIGFSLYLEMLDEAVNALKEGKTPTLESLLKHETCEIDLNLPNLISDSLIPDVATRLAFYKRIASAKTEEALLEIKIELADRFGKLTDATLFLFEITLLKLKANQLNIKRIDFSEKGGVIEFKAPYLIEVDYLISLIQKQPAHFRLDGSNKLKLQKIVPERQARIHYIDHLLTQFALHVIKTKS